MVHPLVLVLSLALSIAAAPKIPAYVKQCQLSSPKLTECVIDSIHHLRPFLAKGIPEVELPKIEPYILESLSLALSGGEKGYKITLTDIHVYGLSNFTVSQLKLGSPVEGKAHIPLMKLDADYTSSGVLLNIVPASGGGVFHATLGDTTVTVKGDTSFNTKAGKKYFHLDKVDVTLDIKEVKMRVEKVLNNNKVLEQATNLFLEENGHEVLNVLMPQLKVKIAAIVLKVVNQIATHTPMDVLTTP